MSHYRDQTLLVYEELYNTITIYLETGVVSERHSVPTICHCFPNPHLSPCDLPLLLPVPCLFTLSNHPVYSLWSCSSGCHRDWALFTQNHAF